jgi:DNA helicase-2/ATP-dependent DNA helicase PcrA
VAEADPDEDAVHVLTVHKAKGLEFPVVFLVSCAEQKFPVQRRREAIPFPDALAKETLAPADAHVHEERRLFYVAMTRAKDELVLTSAADYGTARARKVSRFVVEALDLPSAAPAARKSQPRETLARHQPAPEPPALPEASIPETQTLRLSSTQIDDYRTCPLKYRYIHILRVPLLTHHRIVYGSAIHKAVQQLFEARLAGRAFGEDDLVAAFRGAWVSEGFLSREHEERRMAAGDETLRRFFREQEAEPWLPTAVEKEFAFAVGGEVRGGGSSASRALTRVQGRYDLVMERDGYVAIVDFKTSALDDAKKARERARESLQLDIYALAYLKTEGRLPDWVELRFLESGVAGGKAPTLGEASDTEALIGEVAALIRRREFGARPSWNACGQCPFRDICPHTARGPETEV